MTRWYVPMLLVLAGVGTTVGIMTMMRDPMLGGTFMMIGGACGALALWLYTYYTFKGMCQLSEGTYAGGFLWRSVLNFITLGLYGFLQYDPDDEKEAADRRRAARRLARGRPMPLG